MLSLWAELSPVWAFVFALVTLSVLVASLYLLARVAAIWQTEGHLLPYEPRRPVPWESLGAFLAVLFTVAALMAQVDARGKAVEPPPLREIAGSLASNSAQTFAVCVMVAGLIALMSQARWRDFGFPRSFQECWQDFKLGFYIWLLTIVPVFGLHAVLIKILQTPAEHPITDALTDDGFAALSFGERCALVAASFFSAVVVAPICEELSFRVLLQGWLEKYLSSDPLLPTDGVEHADSEAPSENPNSAEPDSVEHDQDADEERTVSHAHPSGSLLTGALLGSAFLFALAHLGHGPAPLPLFVLAMIYGYVYRCTHRILPTVVAHALFNGTTLIALLISLFQVSD